MPMRPLSHGHFIDEQQAGKNRAALEGFNNLDHGHRS